MLLVGLHFPQINPLELYTLMDIYGEENACESGNQPVTIESYPKLNLKVILGSGET